MKGLNDIIKKLALDSNIGLADIPDIDLYMDQVIQLFENKFKDTKRDEDEKVLTKTMINNYAKGKLFFPIKNKKYSKEHIILISLIYQMKGALSINDIRETLASLNENIENEKLDVSSFYKSYLSLTQINNDNFMMEINERAEEVQSEVKEIDGGKLDYLEDILLIASLVNISNLYRRAAERIIDTLKEEKKDE